MAKTDDPITDEQIIALRETAQHHLSIGGLLEQDHARQLLLWCNEALRGTRNSREARAICWRALTSGTDYLTREMHTTYARARDGALAVLPPPPDTRSAYVSRGYENGVQFIVVGVRVEPQLVSGSHDRVHALKTLERRLLEALADVRTLRNEVEVEENPNPVGAAQRYKNL